MSRKYAIRIHQLSKKYKVGRRLRYRMFRDVLLDTAKNISRRISSPRNGADDTETLWALKDINFDVNPGDSLGIVGNNGAGKSTLLKILSRVTVPTSGYAHLRGRVGSLLEVGTGFHPELTGRENIFLNGAILGMRKREIERKFDEIVAFSEVEKFLDTPVKFYSSGMRVRLAFAVAAHLEPEILLVDEVLAVGDVAFQKKSISRMEDVAREGRTVIFVSHNMAAVRALCKTGVYIEKGKVLYLGDVNEAIEQYLKTNEGVSEPVDLASEINSKEPVQLLAAQILSHENVPATVLPHDQPFTVQLTFAILENQHRGYFSAYFHDANLQTIFGTYEFEQNEDNLTPLSPGVYTYRLTIPGQLFVPGEYRISLRMVRPKRLQEKILFAANHILPFDIYDNGSVYSRVGLKRPGAIDIPIRWEREKTKEL